MKSELTKSIFAYQMREDSRLWREVIMPLPENLFYVDTGYSWGSLQRECAHVIDAMQGYMQRLHGSQQVVKLFAKDMPGRAGLREHWQAVASEWRAYMRRFDDAEFERRVQTVYRDTRITAPAWQLVFQVFNHNTLHRAEMLQIVAVLTGEPIAFERGFADFLAERNL